MILGLFGRSRHGWASHSPMCKPSYEDRITLDSTLDDVIIRSTRQGNSVFNTNGRIAWQFDSIFTATEIQSRLLSGSPNAGILLVEVHYNYHQVLGLPWLAI